MSWILTIQGIESLLSFILGNNLKSFSEALAYGFTQQLFYPFCVEWIV